MHTRPLPTDPFLPEDTAAHLRAPPAKIVHIDSRFSTPGADPNQYIFEFPEPISNISRLQVEEVDMAISFFNVSSQIGNNRIVFWSSARQTVVIPDGYYTKSALVTAVNTALQQADITELTIIASATGHLAIQHSGDTELTWTAEWGEPVITDTRARTLGYLLGFRAIATTVAPGGTARAEAQCWPLMVFPYLFLAVDDYSNSGNSQVLVALGSVSLSSSPILAKLTIPTTAVAYGDRIVATQSPGHLLSGVRRYEWGTKLRKLRLTWLDPMGNPVNLNSIPFSVCLRVS